MTENLKVIISAEIKKLQDNVNKAKKEVTSFKDQVKKAGEDVDQNFAAVGDSIKKGLTIGTAAIAAAGTALLALAGSTKEYRNAQGQLAAAFETAGSTAETAKTTYNDLFRTLGDSGKATEAATHLAKLTQNQEDLSTWTAICQGAYATFGDSLPIEGLTEASNETAKTGQLTGVLADALNWAGVSEDKFQESLDKCNTEAEREKLIREQLISLYSDAAVKYEKNNSEVLAQNAAQAKLDETLAKVGESLAPVITALTELATNVLATLTPYIQSFAENYLPVIKDVLGEVSTKLGEALEFLGEHKVILGVMAGIIAGITTAITLYNVVAAVKAAMDAAQVTTVWALVAAYAAQAAAMVVALAPYLLITAAIAAVIAIIVLCIKHWDEIKEATAKAIEKMKEAVQKGIDKIVEIFNKVVSFVKDNWQGLLLLIVNPFAGAFKLAYDNCEGFRNKVDGFVTKLKNGVKAGFEFVKNSIINPIKEAKEKIGGIVDGIKSLFNFEFKLPKLKTPSFSIKPSGWSVGDLLKGSIPKLSVSWNAVGGVFESPTILRHGNSLQGLAEDGAEAIVPLEKNTQWLDKIADKLSARQSSAPVVLNVDGKVFAQTAISTINENTRQTGSLKLNIM